LEGRHCRSAGESLGNQAFVAASTPRSDCPIAPTERPNHTQTPAPCASNSRAWPRRPNPVWSIPWTTSSKTA
jgi:hypothetical protein